LAQVSSQYFFGGNTVQYTGNQKTLFMNQKVEQQRFIKYGTVFVGVSPKKLI
jgi:hypothetical protein